MEEFRIQDQRRCRSPPRDRIVHTPVCPGAPKKKKRPAAYSNRTPSSETLHHYQYTDDERSPTNHHLNQNGEYGFNLQSQSLLVRQAPSPPQPGPPPLYPHRHGDNDNSLPDEGVPEQLFFFNNENCDRATMPVSRALFRSSDDEDDIISRTSTLHLQHDGSHVDRLYDHSISDEDSDRQRER